MKHDWQQHLSSRLAPLRLRPEREIEIIDELAQHLDDQVRERVSAGIDLDEATRDALAELDAPGVLAQRLRSLETRSPYALPPPGAPTRGQWLSACWQDLRHSIRSLRRTPAFTLTVIAVMALTIGPTTAMLSIGNWLVWRPLPAVANPDRLGVVQFATWRTDSYSPSRISPLNIVDILASAQTIQAMAGTQEGPESVAVQDRPAESVATAWADAHLFDTLGIRPRAGRFFTAAEDVLPYGTLVAVVSEPFAQRLFGTAEQAVGKTIVINRLRFSVIGVVSAGFRGITPFSAVEIWYPGAAYRQVHHFSVTTTKDLRRDGGAFSQFVVRLKPEASFEALAAELDVLAPRLAERFPEDNSRFKTVRARVFPGMGTGILERDGYASMVRRLLLIGGVLVLLGCANVANLLMFRGVRRSREHGVRLALGASRSRLMQLQLMETCVLAVAGAVVGVAVAAGVTRLIVTLVIPRLSAADLDVTVPIDGSVLLATLGVAMLAGVSAGMLPAWIGATRLPLVGAMQSGARGSRRGRRLRTGFAAIQLALSLSLLVGALFLVTTIRGLLAVDRGFDFRGVTQHAVDLAGQNYKTPDAIRYLQDLRNGLTATPGISSVSFSSGYPMATHWNVRLQLPGADPAARLEVRANAITKDYFAIVGIPLVKGRGFTTDEELTIGDASGNAVVVSESLAQRLFGTAEAIGRTFNIPSGKVMRTVSVVGVAGNVRPSLLKDDAELTLYEPFAREDTPATTRPGILVKSALTVQHATALVKAAGARADPNAPVTGNRPLSSWVDRQLSEQRVFAWVLSLLGAFGFVLAAVGLYGLLAETVMERTREFGIRMAIGASRGQVFALVLKHAAAIAVIGGGTGLVLAMFGVRLIESQLFGVTKWDPRIYALATAALAVVVFAAAAWPARAATRVEPVEALRAD